MDYKREANELIQKYMKIIPKGKGHMKAVRACAKEEARAVYSVLNGLTAFEISRKREMWLQIEKEI